MRKITLTTLALFALAIPVMAHAAEEEENCSEAQAQQQAGDRGYANGLVDGYIIGAATARPQVVIVPVLPAARPAQPRTEGYGYDKYGHEYRCRITHPCYPENND